MSMSAIDLSRAMNELYQWLEYHEAQKRDDIGIMDASEFKLAAAMRIALRCMTSKLAEIDKENNHVSMDH